MKFKTLALLVATIYSVSLNAQRGQTDLKHNFPQIESILSQEQIKMLESQKEIIRMKRDSFRKSLTEEQKSIMKSRILNLDERRRSIMASLNDEQRDLLETHEGKIKILRKEFKESLSNDQKEFLRKTRLQYHGRNKGNQRGGSKNRMRI